MSLNGDMLVMRNGRSTSQVSVYNYPEHLNPFYEDDQHKRLRFWRITKKDDNVNRRNSFSISSLNLRDLWAFKSFRLKKKSSTLGINKTSESPPPLRRDVQCVTSGVDPFGSFDRRSRYASSDNASNDSDFQRNGIYRSSLQNVHSSQDTAKAFGFNRNEPYRSTIQFIGTEQRSPQSSTMSQQRKYVYGRSLTPQPIDISDCSRGNEGRVLARGSSQLSVASSNPFDTADEADNEDVLTGIRYDATSTPIKKTARRKRRAPAPPTPIMQITKEEDCNPETQNETSHQNKLEEEHLNISNLTAEIESFVQATNHDSTITERVKVDNETSEVLNSSELRKNDKLKGEEHVISTINDPECTEIEKGTNLMPDVPRELALEEHNINELKEASDESKHRSLSECTHVHVRNSQTQQLESKTQKEDYKSTDKIRSQNVENVTAKVKYTLNAPPPKRDYSNLTDKTHSETSIDTHLTIREPFMEELKITEVNSEKDSNLDDTPKRVKPPIPTKPSIDMKNNFHSWMQPLKSPRGISQIKDGAPNGASVGAIKYSVTKGVSERECYEDNNLTDNGPSNAVSEATIKDSFTEGVSERKYLANNTLTDRLEIIESENIGNVVDGFNGAEQKTSYLREDFSALIRQKPTSHLEWKESSLAPLEKNVPPARRRSVKDIIESINKSQRLLKASAQKEFSRPESADTGLSNTYLPKTFFQSQDQQILEDNIVVHRNKNSDILDVSAAKHSNTDPQKLNNSEIFQKCRVNKEVYQQRETSPTASNLDWNPVPKPRRSKTLPDS